MTALANSIEAFAGSEHESAIRITHSPTRPRGRLFGNPQALTSQPREVGKLFMADYSATSPPSHAKPTPFGSFHCAEASIRSRSKRRERWAGCSATYRQCAFIFQLSEKTPRLAWQSPAPAARCRGGERNLSEASLFDVSTARPKAHSAAFGAVDRFDIVEGNGVIQATKTAPAERISPWFVVAQLALKWRIGLFGMRGLRCMARRCWRWQSDLALYWTGGRCGRRPVCCCALWQSPRPLVRLTGRGQISGDASERQSRSTWSSNSAD